MEPGNQEKLESSEDFERRLALFARFLGKRVANQKA